MRDSFAIGILSAIALSFMLWLAWTQRERVLPGHNDFIQLYTGARLAFTGELYDRARVTEVQQEAVGVTGEAWRYTRLPYYAGLLWPLGLLPYRAAYGVWQVLSIGALAGFAALWRPPRLGLTVLFTLLSLPVFAGLMNGQDLSFVLLWLALAARWHKSGRPFWAGVALALCASKFHLFVLLPVWIVGQRAWRLAPGLDLGGAAASGASGGGSFLDRFMRFKPSMGGGSQQSGPQTMPFVDRMPSAPAFLPIHRPKSRQQLLAESLEASNREYS